MMSAVRQGFWFFSQHRAKYDSTEVLEQLTVPVGSKGRAVSSWVPWWVTVGTSTSSGEEPGVTRAESSSSSKRLVQPREVSTLPARNCSLCWHGQEEKYDGKQED